MTHRKYITSPKWQPCRARQKMQKLRKLSEKRMIPETTSGILNGNDSLTTCNDLMILMLPGTWGSRRDKG